MRLVILGAGGFGRTVYDIAKQSKKYDDIFFLDDNGSSENIKGKTTQYTRYINDEIFPAFGNNFLRLEWINRLVAEDYTIPTIVHESAYIGMNVKIGRGTIIMPNVIVNADCEIGVGCILNMGCIVDHECVIEPGCHICLGAIVKSLNRIPSVSKVEAGEIILTGRYPI